MTANEFLLQRLSAMVMAPLVVMHLLTIILAVQGGLSGEEILDRTRGNWAMGTLYATFVIAAAVHTGIGMSNILAEWAGMARQTARVLGHAFGSLLLVIGLRAVWAVL